MSKLNPTPPERTGGPAPFQSGPDGSVPEPEADFAGEHTDTTFADDEAGGPEGVHEPESPHNRAGMD